MACRCMGAGADGEKGKRAGFLGTPLSKKRLKLAKKTKEDRQWLLEGHGVDSHLNKGTGAVMGKSTGGGARLRREGKKKVRKFR